MKKISKPAKKPVDAKGVRNKHSARRVQLIMSKKNIGLVLLLVVLGVIYLRYFTDLFRTPTIQISARPRIERSRHGKGDTFSVSFSFDQKHAIKELKVVAVADSETNKYPHALWNLVAETNAVPLKGFAYGEFVKGMKSKVPKVRPEPLQSQIKYRLLVDAGNTQGQVDFQIPNLRSAR